MNVGDRSTVAAISRQAAFARIRGRTGDAPIRPRKRAGAAFALAFALLVACTASTPRASAAASCPERPPLQTFTGAGRITCPCFAAGEQAGVVFTAPEADYPLEVLRVGIAWGSQSGGTPATLARALHVYSGGLPDPGSPVFTLDGPVLNDGAINQFDLEPLPGAIVIPSGPFTVALEFQTANAGIPFAPSTVHDGNGCQSGKNVVYATPGGWLDACALGVSGDWVFFVVYRPCTPTTAVESETPVVASTPYIKPPRPNPSRATIDFEFVLGAAQHAALSIYDLGGRRITRLADATFTSGSHRVTWNGRTSEGARAKPGMYFVELMTADQRARRRVVIVR